MGPGDGGSCAQLPPAQRTASPAQTGRGVVEGKQRGIVPHPRTPNMPPEGTWRETSRKITSSQQDLKR